MGLGMDRVLVRVWVWVRVWFTVWVRVRARGIKVGGKKSYTHSTFWLNGSLSTLL